MSGWQPTPPHFPPPFPPHQHSQPAHQPHQSNHRENSRRDNRGSKPPGRDESGADERGYGLIPLPRYIPHPKLVHRHPQHFPFEHQQLTQQQQQRYHAHPTTQPSPSSWPSPPMTNGYSHSVHHPPHQPQPSRNWPTAAPLPPPAHNKVLLPQPPPRPPPSSSSLSPAATIRIGFS